MRQRFGKILLLGVLVSFLGCGVKGPPVPYVSMPPDSPTPSPEVSPVATPTPLVEEKPKPEKSIKKAPTKKSKGKTAP